MKTFKILMILLVLVEFPVFSEGSKKLHYCTPFGEQRIYDIDLSNPTEDQINESTTSNFYFIGAHSNIGSSQIYGTGFGIQSNNNYLTPYKIYSYCYYPIDNSIYAGTDNGLYKLSYNSTKWIKIDSDLNSKKISKIIFSNNLLLFLVNANQNPQIYFYDNQEFNSISDNINSKINCMIYDGSYIYVGTSGDGVWRYSIITESWEECSTGLNTTYEKSINDICIFNDKLFIATNGGIFSALKNQNINWDRKQVESVGESFIKISTNDSKILVCGLDNDKVYLSDNGVSYSKIYNVPSSNGSNNSILLYGNNIYIGYYSASNFNNRVVSLSTNLGQTWISLYTVYNGISYLWGNVGYIPHDTGFPSVNTIDLVNNEIYIGFESRQVYTSARLIINPNENSDIIPTITKYDQFNYQCHAYAWHLSEGGDEIAITETMPYWTGNGYEEVSWGDPNNGELGDWEEINWDKVVKGDGHSMILSYNNTNKVVSKWSDGPLVEHDIDEHPWCSSLNQLNGYKYFKYKKNLIDDFPDQNQLPENPNHPYEYAKEIKSNHILAENTTYNFKVGKLLKSQIKLENGFHAKKRCYFHAQSIGCAPGTDIIEDVEGLGKRILMDSSIIINNYSIRETFFFEIIPNPANDYIEIYLKSNFNLDKSLVGIQIFNQLGQIVDQFVINNENSIKLSLENYESGCYYFVANCTTEINGHQEILTSTKILNVIK